MTSNDAVTPIIAALSISLGVPVRVELDLRGDVGRAAARAVDSSGTQTVGFEVDGGRYLAARYHSRPNAVVVLGPYRRPTDPDSSSSTFEQESEGRARDALSLTAEGLRQVVTDSQHRSELVYQLEVVGRAVLAVTSELDIDVVLRRIVDLARELAGARYAALGIPGANYELTSFITSGMTPEQEQRIGPLPRGHGILGLLQREARTFRLSDIGAHPASVGFPAHHPPMKSFLGVPIISRGQPVGHLYLTEKRFRDEFTEEDVRLVELLARHAAVAIENARLFESLKEQRRSLQVILDQLPEGILLVESNPDRIALANPQASGLLGWDIQPPVAVDVFVERNMRTLNGRAMLAGDIPLLRSLRSGEELRRVEMGLIRPDGSAITMLVNSAPLRSADGEITGAVVVFQDITQIKDAEQLKDDFLSLVSHELRTPLTTIQGNSLMLLRDREHLDMDLQESMLADVSSESRRLAILIENMVQLASIRAGRLAMDTEPVLVKALIEEAVAGVRHLAPDRVITAIIEPELLAPADPGRLDQVVRNLLHNAIKYSPDTSPVEIVACSRADLVEIAIRDYGEGISESEFPYIFDRFQRSEQVVARGTPGMGLGLYLARHLVEAHGGRIRLERPDGGGTRVVITIPRFVAEP